MADLDITLPATEAGSALPVEKQVSLTSSDGKRIDVDLTSDQAWLTPVPANGAMTATGLDVNMVADISGLQPGDYTATVSAAATNNTCATNTPYEVQADLTITQPTPPASALASPMIGLTSFIELTYGYTGAADATVAPPNALTYPILNLGTGSFAGLSASTSSANIGVSIVGGNLELDLTGYDPESISGVENATITINDANASNDGLIIDMWVEGNQEGTDAVNGDDWHEVDPSTSITSITTQEGINPADLTLQVFNITTFNSAGNAAGSGGTHPLRSDIDVVAQALGANARIVGVTDAGGGNSTVEVASGALPGLSNGDTVKIRNTDTLGVAYYDGDHVVSNVTATTFDIPVAFGINTGGVGSVDEVTPTNWIAATPSTAGEDTNLTVSFTTSALSPGIYRAAITFPDVLSTDYVLNEITHTIYVEVVAA